MNYIEIAKFVNFTYEKNLMHKIITLDDSDKPDSPLESLRDYDLNPALVEMHKNFTQNWHNERIVEQMQKDYQEYLTILKFFTYPDDEEEKEIFDTMYSRLEDQLQSPTFLEIGFLDSMLSEDEKKGHQKFKMPNSIWFKVGLKFATGEMKKYSLQEMSAPKIARALELPPGADKYILGTIGNYQGANRDKNIYASEERIQAIADFCNLKNIRITKDFQDRLKETLTNN